MELATGRIVSKDSSSSGAGNGASGGGRGSSNPGRGVGGASSSGSSSVRDRDYARSGGERGRGPPRDNREYARGRGGDWRGESRRRGSENSSSSRGGGGGDGGRYGGKASRSGGGGDPGYRHLVYHQRERSRYSAHSLQLLIVCTVGYCVILRLLSTYVKCADLPYSTCSVRARDAFVMVHTSLRRIDSYSNLPWLVHLFYIDNSQSVAQTRSTNELLLLQTVEVAYR